MRIALVGNQNSGKTTLFNLLTGMNQKIGNWAGVTIEHKSGIIKGTNHELIDLPGIYSLSPYTAEEDVSRQYVFNNKVDLIINIVDATQLERSLYLTTQLMELDCNVVMALNMCDMLEKKGLTIDLERLSDELYIDIVKISALKKTGITELIEAIDKQHNTVKRNKRIYPKFMEDALSEVEQDLREETPHKRFVAVKLLENDPRFEYLNKDYYRDLKSTLENHYALDCEQLIASLRYDYIEHIKGHTVNKIHTKMTATDKLDKIFLNKWASIPIFAGIMILVYMLSVGIVGSLTVDGIGELVGMFSNWFGNIITAWGASEWAVSLVCDGIIAGVGSVLNFVPQLIILFLCISLLETTGYMARIAFLLDRLFKKIGLSGKSLIPFIVGSGCSVPGIMAARTVEDEKERRMTIVLTPFVPCAAKLPIIALFAGFFFDKYAGLVTVGLYFSAIAIIIVSALIMKKVFGKSNVSAFISELPEYKAPSPRYVIRDVSEKTWEFIKRAGSIIFLCSVIIWFLLSFNWKFQYGIEVDNSILASIGNAFAWVFYPIIGEWSWGATVSALQGLVAKEQVVSSMAIIAGFSDSITEGSLIFGSNGIFGFFNGASAFSFMLFNLFSAPCFGAIGAMHKELGSTKRTIMAIGFQTLLAWGLSAIVFGIGSLFYL